jgi:MFS transporter, CP family, cyanate transporter
MTVVIYRLPLWAGRSLAFLRILLVALNLRTAVSSISPIASQIAVDIPLDNTGSVSSAWRHR